MSKRFTPRNRHVAGLLLVTVILAACGSPGSTAAPTAAGTSPSAAVGASVGTPSAVPGSQTTGAGKVNANTATEAELAAAFAAASIPSADRWAGEVAEYRPYDPDPTWAKLRQELGKYNIDPAVLEQIIGVLEL